MAVDPDGFKISEHTIHEPRRWTVEAVIKWLGNFPGDAVVWGYEGEINGIVVEDSNHQESYIQTKESY